MSEYTENYNLILPKETENYDVEIANTNNKAIDTALGGKVNKIIGKGLSTNDFTNEYKKKVDALQTLYRFKGNVETLTELNSKNNNNVGDTWKCKENGNNYCWNKTEWVNIGTDIDLSAYALKTELELKANKTELEAKASKEELNELQTNTEQAIQDVADTVVTETATQIQNGLMSKEDKIKLDGLENTEVIQKDGQANSTNVYSAEATKQIIESTKGWNLHEEVTGNQPINIADLEFTELLIVAKFNNTEGNYMLGSSLVLPKEILTETLEYYDMGSTVYITRIGINKNYLVLNMCSAYGNDFASTTNIKVFYK